MVFGRSSQVVLDVDRVKTAARRHSWRLAKTARNTIRPDQGSRAHVLITGCQRSGTTLLSRIFDADPSAYIFDEISSLSSGDQDEGLRLNDLADVSRQLDGRSANLVVAKPLVESQRLTELLDNLDDTKSIWMYRHYRDVVSSNMVRFGDDNGYSDIAPVVEGDLFDWRSEALSDELRKTFASLSAGPLTRDDAAALFWVGRNSHFFSQGLEHDPRVRLQRYADLVSQPEDTMRSIYQFIGRDYPGERILRDIRSSSVGKGSSVELSPHVQSLCDEMLEGLDQAKAVRA